MSSIHRRNIVVAGLAVAAGLASGAAPAADDVPDIFGGFPDAKDVELASVVQDLHTYMISEEVTIKLEGDRHSRDLVITSARDKDLLPIKVSVRSASMRVFRADPNRDEFTKAGGVYWNFRGKEGKVQLKQAGALVMVIRDRDDTARFYTLVPDMRC